MVRLKDTQKKLDQHLTVMHEQLAKSIHIIDKHSLEMDDLAVKISNIQSGLDSKQDSNQVRAYSQVILLNVDRYFWQVHINS